MQFERRQAILRLLEQHHTATVRQLAEAVYASEASVRRDIEALEKQGCVQKLYGGVVLAQYKNSVIPLSLRDSEHAAAKEQLAQKAAALIHDGAAIFLDASSTARRSRSAARKALLYRRRVEQKQLRLLRAGSRTVSSRRISGYSVFFQPGTLFGRRDLRRIRGGNLAAAGHADPRRKKDIFMRFLQTRTKASFYGMH